MKIAYTIIRLLLGALMLFASISYFFNLTGEQPEPTGDLATLMAGLKASKYIFPVCFYGEQRDVEASCNFFIRVIFFYKCDQLFFSVGNVSG